MGVPMAALPPPRFGVAALQQSDARHYRYLPRPSMPRLTLSMMLRLGHLPRRSLSTSPALPHVTCMRRGDGERAQFDPLAPTALFLHGILGSGKNWSTFAKRVAQQCALQAVLLDLRCHGA
jgi:pimeloyl-ACP methyl ester carboxylesterase